MFSKITSEDENEVIEKLANFIVKKGMEIPATMFLEIFKPMAFVGTQMGLVGLFPILALMGESGFKFLRVLEKPENLERVLKRIEELVEKRKKIKRTLVN